MFSFGWSSRRHRMISPGEKDAIFSSGANRISLRIGVGLMRWASSSGGGNRSIDVAVAGTSAVSASENARAAACAPKAVPHLFLNAVLRSAMSLSPKTVPAVIDISAEHSHCITVLAEMVAGHGCLGALLVAVRR